MAHARLVDRRPTGLRRVLARARRPGGLAVARRRADEVVEVGDVVLCITVRRRGTRSEGRVGRLFDGGRERRHDPIGTTVAGTRLPDVVAFEFLGWDRPQLWSTSGWAVAPTDLPHRGPDDPPSPPARSLDG